MGIQSHVGDHLMIDEFIDLGGHDHPVKTNIFPELIGIDDRQLLKFGFPHGAFAIFYRKKLMFESVFQYTIIPSLYPLMQNVQQVIRGHLTRVCFH